MIKHKNRNIHPGSILREDIIKEVGLTVGGAADLLQVTRLTLSNVLNEKSSITPNLAIRISKVFGGKADFWLRMQRAYDLHKAENEFDKLNINLSRFELA